MLEHARKQERERASGQTSLFDMFGDEEEAQEFDDSVPAPDGIE